MAFFNGTAKVKDLSTTDIEWFKSYGHTVEETTEEVTTEETNVEEAKTEEVSKNKKGK